jgi:hypothetical protein
MATVSSDTISLEKSTNLGNHQNGILKRLYDYCKGNENLYDAILNILVSGYKTIIPVNQASKTPQFTKAGSDICSITPDFYNWFVGQVDSCGWRQALANCPCNKSGQLQHIGALGAQTRLGTQIPINPMTGPTTNTPSLVTDALNSIHPGAVDELENFCNVIRTHSYLSLPSDTFGGLSQALWYITGAITAFYQAIVEIYQGVQAVIQQFYAWINGIMRMIQQKLISIIDNIIPLRLVCLILDAVQTVLDDVGFFAQLFGASDQLFQTLNSIQTGVNYASFGVNFAYNPIAGLEQLFPQQAQQVFNFVNNITDFPNSCLGKLATNYGFGTVCNNKGLQIANTIIQHYGLGAQLGPLQGIIASAGISPNNSQWSRTFNTGVSFGGQQLYPYFIPNAFGGAPLDVALNPFGYTGAAATDFIAAGNNFNASLSDLKSAVAAVF